MCLTVREVPFSWRHGLVVSALKRVEFYRFSKTWVTPFRGTKIPATGKLFVKSHAKRKIRECSHIHGGFVHSYNDCFQHDSPDPVFPAYAIGVVAYGDYDVASIGVYIPGLDLSLSDMERRVAIVTESQQDPCMRTLKKLAKEFSPLLLKYPSIYASLVA